MSGGLRQLKTWAAVPMPGLGAVEEPAAATVSGRCELCPSGLSEDHRHLLQLDDRRIVCVCETCWSMRSGDAEYRPAGVRTLWLDDFRMPDDLWAELGIPIGLTFAMRSSSAGRIVALYPSPAGATECELELSSWDRLCALNPILERLEPDAEALVIDRTGAEHRYLIAPIDQCYRLVGLIKAGWEGISGGKAVDNAVQTFFDAMRARAAVGVGGS